MQVATKLAAVKFNFHGTATPDYLQAHHIQFFYYKGGDHTVLIEVAPADQLRVYIQRITEGLYLLKPAQLSKLLGGKEVTAASLQKVAWGRVDAEALAAAGEVVFINYAEEEQEAQGMIGLRDGAHAAALQQGVTNATARWYSSFVECVFHGYSHLAYDYRIEYTSEGARLSPSKDDFSPELITEKRQLKKLANADLLTSESIRGTGAVLLKFKQETLPGINFEKSPSYFRTLIF